MEEYANWTAVGTDFPQYLDSHIVTTAPLSEPGNAAEALGHSGLKHFSATAFQSSSARGVVIETPRQAYQAAQGRELHSADTFEAYWVPQGQALDIPAHPQPGQPKVLLTPDFSGCSLVVQDRGDGRLRVSHVEGGHEPSQLYDRMQGDLSRMSTAMSHRDYTAKGGEQAFAYMHYQDGWNIHWQERSVGAIAINRNYDNGSVVNVGFAPRVIATDERSASDRGPALAGVRASLARHDLSVLTHGLNRSESPPSARAPIDPSASLDSASRYARGREPDWRDTATYRSTPWNRDSSSSSEQSANNSGRSSPASPRNADDFLRAYMDAHGTGRASPVIRRGRSGSDRDR